MNINEVVRYVERNKLPQDKEWLRGRIFDLIDEMTHLRDVGVHKANEYRNWRAGTLSGAPFVAGGTVVGVPFPNIENAAWQLARRNLDMDIIEALTKLYEIGHISMTTFPGHESFVRVSHRYKVAKEDLERTLRAYGRFLKKS